MRVLACCSVIPKLSISATAGKRVLSRLTCELDQGLGFAIIEPPDRFTIKILVFPILLEDAAHDIAVMAIVIILCFGSARGNNCTGSLPLRGSRCQRTRRRIDDRFHRIMGDNIHLGNRCTLPFSIYHRLLALLLFYNSLVGSTATAGRRSRGRWRRGRRRYGGAFTRRPGCIEEHLRGGFLVAVTCIECGNDAIPGISGIGDDEARQFDRLSVFCLFGPGSATAKHPRHCTTGDKTRRIRHAVRLGGFINGMTVGGHWKRLVGLWRTIDRDGIERRASAIEAFARGARIVVIVITYRSTYGRSCRKSVVECKG